jgi:hypothetical protein
MANGEFTIEIDRRPAIAPDILRDFGDVNTVATFCFDENGDEIFYAHHYESPSGRVLYREKKGAPAIYLDGKMDPKRLFEGGVQYHLERGSKKEA